jgi:predicted aspartyl protease
MEEFLMDPILTPDSPGGRTARVGRFTVEFELTNYRDAHLADAGALPKEAVRRMRLSGVVDTGATRLVLPQDAVTALGLPLAGMTSCRFADGRREEREVVADAYVEIQGRSGVFKAVVEPGRRDALIGAIVLEDLDFVADCVTQRLVPRDPRGIFTEIDEL